MPLLLLLRTGTYVQWTRDGQRIHVATFRNISIGKMIDAQVPMVTDTITDIA